jgi:hypothetical protein
LKRTNGVGGEYPPYGIFVNFRLPSGDEVLSGYTGTLTNTPSGKIELVFIESNTRKVFFAPQVLEWEERLPTRAEFDMFQLAYMPGCANREQLGNLDPSVESAVVVDMSLFKSDVEDEVVKRVYIYLWEWANGKWSDNPIEVVREFS